MADTPPTETPAADTGSTAPAETDAGTDATSATALNGWAALQHAVNVTQPTLLSHAEALNRQTLGILGS